MAQIILFIRDVDIADIADIQPDETSARNALKAYVRRRTPTAQKLRYISEDDAVDAYFRKEGALYTIARVTLAKREPGENR